MGRSGRSSIKSLRTITENGVLAVLCPIAFLLTWFMQRIPRTVLGKESVGEVVFRTSSFVHVKQRKRSPPHGQDLDFQTKTISVRTRQYYCTVAFYFAKAETEKI